MASNISGPVPDAPAPTMRLDVVSDNGQIPAGIVGANCNHSVLRVPVEWPGGKDGGVAMMHVEHLVPKVIEHKVPIILIHGDFHSGDVWLNKPDFGTGWAAYFVNRGYRVYIVHLPGSGFSSLPTTHIMPGQMLPRAQGMSPKSVENQLTAPERNVIRGTTAWPTAGLHNKWPGTGQNGDLFFHRYHCTLQVLLVQKPVREMVAQNGLRNLLAITGRAILIGQGAGSTAAWLAADAVPHLVAKVVAIEPAGPPAARAHSNYPEGRVYSPWLRRDDSVRKFGLADIPLTFEPQVTGPALDFEVRQLSDNSGCYMVQRWRPGGVALPKPLKTGQESVPQLVHLKQMRHAIITAEASSHSMFDWATVLFMRQAGVTMDHIDLAKFGIRGNGHLMFLETNSDEIAEIVANWIEDTDEEPVRSRRASLDQEQATLQVVDAPEVAQVKSALSGNGGKQMCHELDGNHALPPLKRQKTSLQSPMAEQSQALNTKLQTPLTEFSQAHQLTNPGYAGLQSPAAEHPQATSNGPQSLMAESSHTHKPSDMGQTDGQYHMGNTVKSSMAANTGLQSPLTEPLHIRSQSLDTVAFTTEAQDSQPKVLLQPEASYPSPKKASFEDLSPVIEPAPAIESRLPLEPTPAIEPADLGEYAPLTEYNCFADFLQNLSPGEEAFFPFMGHLSDQATMAGAEHQVPLNPLLVEDPWKDLEDSEFLKMFQ